MSCLPIFEFVIAADDLAPIGARVIAVSNPLVGAVVAPEDWTACPAIVHALETSVVALWAFALVRLADDPGAHLVSRSGVGVLGEAGSGIQ